MKFHAKTGNLVSLSINASWVFAVVCSQKQVECSWKLKWRHDPTQACWVKEKKMSCRDQSSVSSVAFSTNQDEIEEAVENIAEKLWKRLDFVKFSDFADIWLAGNQLFRMNVRINLISIVGYELSTAYLNLCYQAIVNTTANPLSLTSIELYSAEILTDIDNRRLSNSLETINLIAISRILVSDKSVGIVNCAKLITADTEYTVMNSFCISFTCSAGYKHLITKINNARGHYLWPNISIRGLHQLKTIEIFDSTCRTLLSGPSANGRESSVEISWWPDNFHATISIIHK